VPSAPQHRLDRLPRWVAELLLSRRGVTRRSFSTLRHHEDHATPAVDAEALTETPTIRRQFILTPSADLTLKHVVAVYSKAAGSELTNSHFLRVMLKAIAHAMPQLEQEAEHMGKLKRPKNDRANEAQREEFERKLASSLVTGMRAAPDLG
jgi:hypothetical protein